MIQAIISDFSRVILFPNDPAYKESLNTLHVELVKEDEQYRFSDHFLLNKDLLDFYRSLNVVTYIFTSGMMQYHEPLHSIITPYVKEIFTSSGIGFKKSNPEAYRTLANQIGYEPRELLFVDDLPENIEAADKVGYETVLFTGNEGVMKKIGLIIDAYS